MLARERLSHVEEIEEDLLIYKIHVLFHLLSDAFKIESCQTYVWGIIFLLMYLVLNTCTRPDQNAGHVEFGLGRGHKYLPL